MPDYHTQTATPERAAALRQAGEEIDEVLAVSILDPSVPEDAARYATLEAAQEARWHESGMQPIGVRNSPRTAEQIRKEVVEAAQKTGRVLVLIQHDANGTMAPFWERADQIAAERSSTNRAA